jgi:hypothetical protein
MNKCGQEANEGTLQEAGYERVARGRCERQMKIVMLSILRSAKKQL